MTVALQEWEELVDTLGLPVKELLTVLLWEMVRDSVPLLQPE